MDSIFAIKGKDFVLVAQETTVTYSIFKLKPDQDKTIKLDDHLLLAMAGDNAQVSSFGNYVAKNIQLLKFKNGWDLTVSETANWIRSTLAQAIRKNPHQVDSLVAGFDTKGPQLFWLDHLGTCSSTNFGAHGYCAYFVSSVLNSFYKEDLSLDEAKQACKYAINELRTRFMLSQENFVIKIVNKDGVKIIPLE